MRTKLACEKNSPVLIVKNLKTYFFIRRGIIKAVDGVSFHIGPGEVVCIVGESGCGKSMTALSILRLIPFPAARIVGGEILFKGDNILDKSEQEMRKIRGKGISMIPQDPMVSLDPVFSIGSQVGEAFLNLGEDNKFRTKIRQRVLDVLGRVNIPSPELRLKEYPHQFSGGMRQRVVAAIAIAAQPDVLIADEPTTALDVTVQAQLLDLLRELVSTTGMALIYITHDLGVVAQIADRVLVMYAGRVIETGSVIDIFEKPKHPYTSGLMTSIPRLEDNRETLYQIEGQPPDLGNLPEGCSFQLRCPKVMSICRREYPPQIWVSEHEWVKCWLHTTKETYG